MENKVIALVGPTATGKSELAVRLAKELKTEIISADSRLVYKKMDIGTAKPTVEERGGIKHHLIDVVEPGETYSLGSFVDDAQVILKHLLKEGKIPIVVGGTGFYFRGLLEDLQITEVEPNHEFRESLEAFSTEELYKKLKSINTPKFSWQMSSNDRYRIIRALEIEKFHDCSAVQLQNTRDFNVSWFGLNTQDRETLRERIRVRVNKMMEAGFIDEVKFLLKKYGELELFRKTIGYSEVIKYFNNELLESELKDKISTATSQYSKRQMTWFRANKEIKWLDCLVDKTELLGSVLANVDC